MKLTTENISAIEDMLTKYAKQKRSTLASDLFPLASKGSASASLSGFCGVMRALGVDVPFGHAKIDNAELVEFRKWKAEQVAK